MKIIILPILALVLSGCATGFNRQAVQERLEGQALEINDADIKLALEKKSQIRFPIKVAVQMTAETYPYKRPELDGSDTDQWRWTVKDKEQIEVWAKDLIEAGIVSDMFVMSDVISQGSDVKSMRLAAAKHGADAVLLIKGVAQVDDYLNPAGILNLLIVPGFFVSGSNKDVLLMMKGAMWDVGNEFLYLSVDAEAEVKNKGPTFRFKENDAIDKAKGKALASFGKELKKRMKALKGEKKEPAE